MEKVKSIELKEGMKVSELVGQMKSAGFGARKIGLANEIVLKMFADSGCRVFLGLAGAMVPSGMKKIIIDMINSGRICALVSTGANLTHDLIEALGDEHYHCDVWDDVDFKEKGFDRMYNVFMKNEVYVKLEKFFEANWASLKGANTVRDFLFRVGGLVENESIFRTCFEKNVPVFCPALADSGIGLMIWGRKAEGQEIKIDAFDDMNELIDLSWTAKKSGVVYVGGGVPKNFIQQSLQFSKGADYGVQISMDREESGGSSGAPLEEGKSWGKLKNDAKFVDLKCDATIALPLIFVNVFKKS